MLSIAALNLWHVLFQFAQKLCASTQRKKLTTIKRGYTVWDFVNIPVNKNIPAVIRWSGSRIFLAGRSVDSAADHMMINRARTKTADTTWDHFLFTLAHFVYQNKRRARDPPWHAAISLLIRRPPWSFVKCEICIVCDQLKAPVVEHAPDSSPLRCCLWITAAGSVSPTTSCPDVAPLCAVMFHTSVFGEGLIRPLIYFKTNKSTNCFHRFVWETKNQKPPSRGSRCFYIFLPELWNRSRRRWMKPDSETETQKVFERFNKRK